MKAQWTRRQLLARAASSGAALAAAGAAGHFWPGGGRARPPQTAAQAAAARPSHPPAADRQTFVSRPDLTPPAVAVTRPGAGLSPAADAARPVFLTVRGKGQLGPMIVDRSGDLVWFSPAPGGTKPMDLRVQTFRGEPVLTWWEGQLIKGVGQGACHVADTSYKKIHTVRAGHGLHADLHEFLITPQDTALITAYRQRTADLSGIGGPAAGVVLSGVAQEIDIASGRVLFEWESLDHVDVTETCQKFAGGTKKKPFDYFHINSIAVAPDGDLIISARNTWTVYKIARPSGTIAWRLGGKRTSFEMGPGTDFYWQHDARPHGPGLLSVFDDGGAPPEERQSRALFLQLDTSAMRARLQRSFTHPAGLLAKAMGNVQALPDGRVFVGWGTEPYFSEFGRDGALVLDGQFPGGDDSYRVFTYPWTGRPAEPPAAAARTSPDGGAFVYASWNGATEVSRWHVLAGASPSSLAAAGAQERTGFETVVAVNSPGPYFCAVAYDSRGRKLGQSRPVALGAA